jgi:sec-independent protein translocase protein TatB
VVTAALGTRNPRLGDVFNLSGSETIFLLLIALVVLGPEKLPEAIRKFGKAYGEFRKMATGFQNEVKSALDEPIRELRGTADAFRQAANFDGVDEVVDDAKRAFDLNATAAPVESTTTDANSAADSAAASDPPPLDPDASAAVGNGSSLPPPRPPIIRKPGVNFGSANPRPAPVRSDVAAAEPAPAEEPIAE